MTRSFLSAGVALNHVGDYGKLIDIHRAANPTTILGMVDNRKDAGLIAQLRDDLPSTTQVIARVYHPEEGGYAQTPQGKDDHRPMIATPEAVLQDQVLLGKRGMLLHVMNEPSAFLNDEQVEKTVDWLVKFIRLAAPENCACVLGNLADQHPRLVNGLWDPLWWPFLKEIALHPALMRLGLHFYGPDNITRIIGSLIETCRELEINSPEIIGTEFGLDSTGQGDKANGYHSRGMSGETFLDWEADAIHDPLRPYIQGGVLLGLNTFQWNLLWGAFSIAQDTGYQNTYKTRAQNGDFDMIVSQSAKEKYKPGELPEGAYSGLYYTVQVINQSHRNLRALPDVNSDDLGDMKTGDTIKMYDQPVFLDPIRRNWHPCIWISPGRDKATICWVWTDGLKLTPVNPQSSDDLIYELLPPLRPAGYIPTPAPQPEPPAPVVVSIPEAPAAPPVEPAPVEGPIPPEETWPEPPASVPPPMPIMRWKLNCEITGTPMQAQLIATGIEKILEGCGYIGLAAGAVINVVPELVTAEMPQ